MAWRSATIDAHHHLWRYNAAEYPWIDERMHMLQRDYLPEDFVQARQAEGVGGSVVVQARQSLEETSWLLQCAAEEPSIRGVVGWAPIAADDLDAILDRFRSNRNLVGLREIVQGQPAGFLSNSDFNRGIGLLAERNLVYDVLISEGQMQEALEFVDRHPRQRFVLDHAAKPRIAQGVMEPWRGLLMELGKRENVSCKLSGLVTEADWTAWRPEQLQPYLDTCVEAFGTKRLMAGSDWPVCRVASSYSRWWSVLRDFFAGFSDDEKQGIFGGNAISVYGLEQASHKAGQ